MLIKIAEVLPYLTQENYPGLTAADFYFIKGLIKEVEGMISSFVGYDINKHEVVEITSGNGTNEISPKEYLTNLKQVFIDPTRQFTSDTLIDLTNFYFDTKTKFLIYLNGNFPSIPYSIKLVYDAGWDSSDVPADLKSVILNLTAKYFDKVRNKTQDVVTHAGLGSSVVFSEAGTLITKKYREVLEKYVITGL